jgi:hypothetical protein
MKPYESQTLRAEHQVLLPAQAALLQEEQNVQEQMEQYRQVLAGHKKKQADEAYFGILQKSEIKWKERQQDLKETRQVEQELELLRQKRNDQRMPTRPKNNKVTSSSIIIISNHDAPSPPIGANREMILKNRNTTKHERRMDRYKEQTEQVQKTHRYHRSRSAERIKELQQRESEEAKRVAERKARNRMKHVRFRSEQEWDNQMTQKLREEQEQAKLHSQAKQGACPETILEEKRAERKANKHSEWARTSSQRREQELEWCQALDEKAQREEEEAQSDFDRAKNKEREVLEHMEKERKKQEIDIAVKEAKVRETANQRALEEQTKAVAAKESQRRKSQPSINPEEVEEEEDDDDDHDWQEEDKARFLAEAKLELLKRNKFLEKQKRNEEQAQQKAQKAREREASRKAALREHEQQELAIAEDTDTPEEILRLEAGGADGDEELERALKDIENYREILGELEHKLHKVHKREAKKIQRIEEKMIEMQYQIHQEAIAGIHHYTLERLEDKDRQAREIKEIMSSWRGDNAKIRSKNQEMLKEIRALRGQNHRMEELIETTIAHTEMLSSTDRQLLDKEHYWEDVIVKYKKAIKKHEEALAYRTGVAESEHRMKELYHGVELKIVSRFQDASDDDVLNLKLGAIVLGDTVIGDDENDTVAFSKALSKVPQKATGKGS